MSHIVVSEFEPLSQVVHLLVLQNGGHTFGPAGVDLDLQWSAFTVMSEKEIYFQTAVPMEIIEFTQIYIFSTE